MRNQLSFIVDRLNRRKNLPFRSKLMNTYDSGFKVSGRDACVELTALTTGGISAIVARKSQTRPLRTGSVSADRKHGD
jgi:hypothetical protein